VCWSIWTGDCLGHKGEREQFNNKNQNLMKTRLVFEDSIVSKESIRKTDGDEKMEEGEEGRNKRKNEQIDIFSEKSQ